MMDDDKDAQAPVQDDPPVPEPEKLPPDPGSERAPTGGTPGSAGQDGPATG